MLDKIRETTITKIEPPAAKKSYQENLGAANVGEGATTFEEFLSMQVKKANITNINDLSGYYDSIKGIGTPAGEGVSSGEPSEYEVTVTNGKASLQDIFRKASEKYDVPYDLLVAVAKAESNFNEKCVSHSGAMGVMQLMPGTAKYLGVKDAYDPEQNIMGGARYLSEKIKEQKGNVSLALAAYNAGSGAVKKYGGIPPYKETQNYVKKVNQYRKEDIEVPNKSFEVSFASSTVSNRTINTKEVQAADIDEAIVVVGEGKNGFTLTYEAYKKYLELLTTGVG